MLENIRISLRGIWSHKMRSFLTMLGIIIGIAAIIAIVSTIMGTNEQIKNNLVGSGNNTVEVQLYADGHALDFAYETSPVVVPAFDRSVEAQVEELPQVRCAAFYHERTWAESLYAGNTSLAGAGVRGIGAGYLDCAGLAVVSGRGFGEGDFTMSRKVALVDATARDAFFDGQDPVGALIDVNGDPFTVVGVVRERVKFEPAIESVQDWYLYSQQGGGRIYIPDQMWPVVYSYDEPPSMLVRAASTDDMTDAGRGAADVLNGYLGAGEDAAALYRSTDLAEEAAQLQQLASSTNTMLVGIASISLLVGGIGVMNIMLVSVTERTREIGLRRALGARRRTIRLQFLTEAVLLSLIGGVIGVVAGIALSNVMAAVAGVPVVLSPAAAGLAMAFSMAVGVVFGLVPSIKASNLSPIEALRYE